MTERTICLGECMVELSASPEPGLLQSGFAGDTFNTAWYLTRQRPGTQVEYFTHVGTDPVSDRMLAFISEAGVGTGHIVRRPDATVGLYQIDLKDGERSFTYWRGQSAARRLADDRGALRGALDGATVVYFSGITLGILSSEGRRTLLEEIARARANGSRIAFDPNLRPKLWSDMETMRSAIMDAAAHVDVALPSFEDEATWFGDADPVAARDRYRDAGVTEIVVKDGSNPVVAWTDESALTLPTLPASMIDSTAAGDSFNAGYLAGRLAGEPVEAAIKRGMALSRIVIGHPGALVEAAVDPIG